MTATTKTPTLSALTDWLAFHGLDALDACDRAMLQPGFQPENTRDILLAGWNLAHAADGNTGLPVDDEQPKTLSDRLTELIGYPPVNAAELDAAI